MRLVNDPSTQYDRTNIVRKLVPKAPKPKEELMDAAKWYENWVPMTLEQYEESYQRIQRRQDRRPPGKVSGRKKPRPRPRVGPPPPKPAARPVLSSFMSAPGPRRPDHPPPGHQDKTKDKTKDKPDQEKNNEKDKPPAQDGLFVPLGFAEEAQEVDLGFSPETSEGNIGDLPLVEEISNDLESFFSSESDPETKPKREYDSNNQISYRPFPSDSEPSPPAGYFTTDYVSPTTAPPLKSDPSKEISLQPLVQPETEFFDFPGSSVTPTPLPDLIFQEQPELSEEAPRLPNRRQAFLGHQIPILSQTTEMNQDQAHSFQFE